jgi:peptidoglycan/xylan/chitin deacetylase (PgdA/CDA1 family)
MYPDLARAVVEAGHEVANHTFTHPTLSKLSSERVNSELQKCQDAIITITGKTPVWFRPPYGAFRKDQGPIPRSKDLGVTYWSVDPQDWAQPGVAKITSRILTAARPGSIILMHDLHKQTAQAVPAIFDGLLEKDFNMTRLTGFLGNPYPVGEVV